MKQLEASGLSSMMPVPVDPAFAAKLLSGSPLVIHSTNLGPMIVSTLESFQKQASMMSSSTGMSSDDIEMFGKGLDQINLGEMQPERDHAYASNHSDLFSFAGRSARQLPWGEGHWLEFDMAVRDAPVLLRVLYWGEEVNKRFDISIDGTKIASERRATRPEKRFVGVDYPLPAELTRGKKAVRVRFETHGTDAFIYEARTLTAE